MIYAGFVKVAAEKPQTGRVKFKVSSATGEAKFSLGEGKNPPGRVSLGLLQRGVFAEWPIRPASSNRKWQTPLV